MQEQSANCKEHKRLLRSSSNLMEHSPVVRLNPTQYAHILDKNLNVTRLISGPLTYVRHDHETLVRGPEEMVLVKPRFYCKVKNPALIKDGKPTLDRNQQIVLAHGEEEIRLSGPPFPLYPGEELLEISPLRVVPAQHALRLVSSLRSRNIIPDIDGLYGTIRKRRVTSRMKAVSKGLRGMCGSFWGQPRTFHALKSRSW